MVTGAVLETVRTARIRRMAEHIRTEIPGPAGNRVRRTSGDRSEKVWKLYVLPATAGFESTTGSQENRAEQGKKVLVTLGLAVLFGVVAGGIIIGSSMIVHKEIKK